MASRGLTQAELVQKVSDVWSLAFTAARSGVSFSVSREVLSQVEAPMAGWEVFLYTKHNVPLLLIEASRSITKRLELDVVTSTAHGFEFGSPE